MSFIRAVKRVGTGEGNCPEQGSPAQLARWHPVTRNQGIGIRLTLLLNVRSPGVKMLMVLFAVIQWEKSPPGG
jgi:hypothetical protein